MRKIVKWFVMNVPHVAPTLLPLSSIAVGIDRISWNPKGIVQP